MKLSCVPRLIFITGLLSLFVLGGDIVADSIADVCGHHCVSETSQSDTDHEKTPCPHCSCAVHNGAVVASSCVVSVSCGLGESVYRPTSDASAPSRLPAAIDHPPQLA
jgi:hypothetical protein